jgi:hypothetical protein
MSVGALPGRKNRPAPWLVSTPLWPGVKVALAVTAPGRSEFAGFATVYFLVQTPLLLTAVFLFRRGVMTAREPHTTERPNDEPDFRADGCGAAP